MPQAKNTTAVFRLSLTGTNSSHILYSQYELLMLGSLSRAQLCKLIV